MSRDWRLRVENILSAAERATRFVGELSEVEGRHGRGGNGGGNAHRAFFFERRAQNQ